MKFSINKYSQAFYRVGPGYRGLAKFIILDQYVYFPGEVYNFSSTDIEFHTVRNAPTLHIVNVRHQLIAVLRIINGSVNFYIVSKSRYLERATASLMSLINTLKRIGPRTDP
jgi:hypothetical protein